MTLQVHPRRIHQQSGAIASPLPVRRVLAFSLAPIPTRTLHGSTSTSGHKSLNTRRPFGARERHHVMHATIFTYSVSHRVIDSSSDSVLNVRLKTLATAESFEDDLTGPLLARFSVSRAIASHQPLSPSSTPSAKTSEVMPTLKLVSSVDPVEDDTTCLILPRISACQAITSPRHLDNTDASLRVRSPRDSVFNH